MRITKRILIFSPLIILAAIGLAIYLSGTYQHISYQECIARGGVVQSTKGPPCSEGDSIALITANGYLSLNNPSMCCPGKKRN